MTTMLEFYQNLETSLSQASDRMLGILRLPKGTDIKVFSHRLTADFVGFLKTEKDLTVKVFIRGEGVKDYTYPLDTKVSDARVELPNSHAHFRGFLSALS